MLVNGVRSVVTSMAGFAGTAEPESVVTPMAGFESGVGFLLHPGFRIAMPAFLKQAAAVSRLTPVAFSIRRRVQPNRPKATT